MVAVKLSVFIGEDRRLVVDLPDNVPIGPAELIIQPESNLEENIFYSEREASRAQLMAVGVIRTYVDVPEDAKPLTLEARLRIGKLPPGSRPSEQLIDEDRGDW